MFSHIKCLNHDADEKRTTKNDNNPGSSGTSSRFNLNPNPSKRKRSTPKKDYLNSEDEEDSQLSTPEAVIPSNKKKPTFRPPLLNTSKETNELGKGS